MSEQVYEQVEVGTYAPEHLERLVRYGERLATGMLPVVEPGPGSHALPEAVFTRNPSWQEHQRNFRLSGLLVGRLNVSLIEGVGVSQLFLNLHYMFPRTYLITPRDAPRPTVARISGRSFFIDGDARIGAVAHVHDVFESDGSNIIPFWALHTLRRYRQQPWPVVRCNRASDAVGAFQRAVSRDALPGIQRVYNEVAAEYGFPDYRQFSWHQREARII